MAAEINLCAGVAAEDISPRKPMFLVGYPHMQRISTGIHDSLLASALYLSDGSTALILMSVDVLFISRESANASRAAISAKCGVPGENILISATHTHSAPVTAGMLAWEADPVVPSPDPEFMQLLHEGVVKAALAACAQARPAQFAATSATVSHVGCNRLSPDGPFDPEAGVLAIRSGGRLMAAVLIYGMHPTVLHEDSTLVSSDFPHFTRKRLEEAFHGVVTLYHTAPCGNLSPRYHVRGQTFSEAERLGHNLGNIAVEALKKLAVSDFRSDVRLRVERGFAEMLPNRFLTMDDAVRALVKARQAYERLKADAAPQGVIRTAECIVFGCEEALTLAKAQAEGRTAKLQEQYRNAEVQVFRIGDVLIAGFPGEQFVEYALQFKAALGGARGFVISLANGELQGYIVTPQATESLSYEAAFALFAPASGSRLVETALNLVERM